MKTIQEMFSVAIGGVVVLFLLFDGGAVAETAISDEMIGSGVMAGINWMWIPTLLMLSLGTLFVWVTSGQEDN